MRHLLCAVLILSGAALVAEEKTSDDSRLRAEEKALRDAQAAEKPSGRQVERTADTDASNAARERTISTGSYEAQLRAAGRTSPATNPTEARRYAEMHARDAKQAEALRARESLRPERTPKSAAELLERRAEQQRTHDQREYDAQTDHQRRKALLNRQGRE